MERQHDDLWRLANFPSLRRAVRSRMDISSDLMRILAIDLGRKCGVAGGDSALLGKGGPVVSGLVLHGLSPEDRVRQLAKWLFERLNCSQCCYDMLVTEAPLNPAGSKSDRATIDMLGYYFCVQTVGALTATKVEALPINSIRKHFVGIAGAPRVMGRKRTSVEAAAARKYINDLVLNRAILLGYLPAESRDYDQANACAIWDFACAKFGRGAL